MWKVEFIKGFFFWCSIESMADGVNEAGRSKSPASRNQNVTNNPLGKKVETTELWRIIFTRRKWLRRVDVA